MHGGYFNNVAIIIFLQVHDLSVSVIKLGGKGFNIPETTFPSYKNGPSLHQQGLLRTMGDGGCKWQFTVFFLYHFYFAVPE